MDIRLQIITFDFITFQKTEFLMLCVSFPRYGILLGSLTATALPAAPLSPADQSAIEQQQKALLEQTQQQRDMLRQLVNVFDEFNQTKRFNTQPVASFIKGETASGANLSTKTADYVKSLQRDNTAKLVGVFNKQNPNAELNVFGKYLQQVLGPGGSDTRGRTKVFASEKLTEDEIISFATFLTGGIPFKESVLSEGRLMYAKINDNQTINIRNFSTSSEITGARWTIEIIGNADIKSASKTSLNRFEVNFR
ncbi:hypothetical protein [Klebsiella pasteurii]|nr:hypothetical protein [Klebsiella pasteurii]MDQ2201145.1 hypothetical protein [Klebsiella pasteurii]